MDYSSEYQMALELASSLRYPEAKQKLESILSDQPDNIDTLILLGKVEYYLRFFPSSKGRFETVLTLDPGNFEAYYGLQFFVERKKRFWTITAWLASIFLLLSIAVFLNTSIRNGLDRFEEGFTAQSRYYLELEKELSDRMLGLSDNLDQYAGSLDNLEESLRSGMEVFKKQIGDFDIKQEERFLKFENTNFKYYRTISEEIKNLKEIAGRLEDGNFAE
ncbi:MAG: hypothetical protein KAH95_06365 [Spirochaetales bacterium]|nr:hypothetical protein [Spirochaetales bacterium]